MAPHVLIFPYPSQGHLIPLLDLAHSLSLRGVSITVVSTPATVPHNFETLVLPVVDAPSGVPATVWALHEFHDFLIEWFRSHPSPPSAIISDMFLGWTHRLAHGLRIPRIVFSPSGALALSTMYFLWRHMPVRHDVVSFSAIPNSPEYPWRQVSPLFRSYVAGDPASELVKDGFRANMASWGLVVNSVTEFERVYLENLKAELGHDRVWAVGPLLSRETADRGGTSSVAVRDVVTWLDACESRGSEVVYVCFGSQVVLTSEQAAAIASGLEKSGAHFIWAAGDGGAIPSGFEGRVGARGMVIRGWAPQVVVLRHRAVSAFVTHCGWNSALEAVAAGVVMVAWPMGADQFVNADLLVGEMKVAVRVCEGSGSVPDSDELARVVAESVSEQAPQRQRVKALREAAVEAMEEGGSSVKDLDWFVMQLAQFKPQDYTDYKKNRECEGPLLQENAS